MELAAPENREITTCVAAQFVDETDFLALIVERHSDDVYVSKVLECRFDRAARSLVTDSMLELEGWLTTFWAAENNDLFVGTADGEVCLVRGKALDAFELTDRAVTRILGQGPDCVYASAADGSVQSWDGQAWSAVKPPSGPALFDLAVGADRRVAVCGQEGALYTLGEAQWISIPLPTNVQLNAVGFQGGDLIAAGNNGVAFRVGPDDARALEGASFNLFSVVEWRGNVYMASSGDGVLILAGDELAVAWDGMRPFGLAAGQDLLVAFSGQELAIFDGTEWHR